MAVLPTADRRLQAVEALPARKLQEPRGGTLASGVIPDCRDKRIGKFVISRVDGKRGREVNPVAIQIDVVLVHPAHPREAERVDRVNQHHREIVRDVHAIPEPGGLAHAPGKSFDSMSARDDEEPVPGVGGAENRHISCEASTVGTRERMIMAKQRRAATGTSIEKRGAGRLIVARELHYD